MCNNYLKDLSLKLQQLYNSGQMGPTIFLTTSNTQSNKLCLLIQLTYTQKYQDKDKGKKSTNMQCKGYIHIELFW